MVEHLLCKQGVAGSNPTASMGVPDCADTEKPEGFLTGLAPAPEGAFALGWLGLVLSSCESDLECVL